MSELLLNARMYSVTPECKAAWRSIFGWVLVKAGLDARYEDHDPPKLLSDLWRRDDLACAQMCGLPFSLRAPPATILAAAVPTAPHYAGRAIYWSDIAVRADADYRTLEDTFGERAGYTLRDSQSGYFAFRYHLLNKYRQHPRPYREIVGNLVNPRGVIQALAEKRVDVGPLDSYVHDLLKTSDPEFASQVRVIERTEPTPMPPLVATADLPELTVARLRAAFLAVEKERTLDAARAMLLLERFMLPDPSVYRVQRERAEAVERSKEVW